MAREPLSIPSARDANAAAPEPSAAREPRTRIVLLGASNLTFALAHVIDELRCNARAPLEILAALGHGRSYGIASRVFARELPGILECGLWHALANAPARTTSAYLTDIGNDIAYGVPADLITRWIDEALARLAAVDAHTTIVRLPIASLERMAAWQFHVVRTLLFPTRRLHLGRVLENARELDRRLVEIARERNATTVVPPGAWYGFDPIHIRRGARAEAWTRILSRDAELTREAAFESSARSLRGARPEQRRFFGAEQSRAQPSVELADGTTVALY